MTVPARSAHADGAVSTAAQPGLASAFREAVVDFYFNSWRLVPANLAWAGIVIATLVAASFSSAGWLLLPVAAVPLAGIHRLAGRIVRGDGGSFAEFVAGMRRCWLPALTAGVIASILAIVFTTNVIVGLQLGSPAGWFISATALYADVGLAMLLVAFWPLLTDPRRDGVPLRRRLRLAMLVNLARPGRMLLLTLLLALGLAVSTVLVATLALVAVAYAGLVGTRYVLRVADLLEGRWPAEIGEPG